MCSFDGSPAVSQSLASAGGGEAANQEQNDHVPDKRVQIYGKTIVAARKVVQTSVHKPRPGHNSPDPRLVAREANMKLAQQLAAQHRSEPLKIIAGDEKIGPNTH